MRQSWSIEYLDDSGNPLQTEDGKFRERTSHGGDLPWGAVFDQSFQSALTDLDSAPPAPWDQLMLEALDELPATGPAVVLAYAAFEQLVNTVISQNVPASYSASRRKGLIRAKSTS
jgi:hypothetical protein